MQSLTEYIESYNINEHLVDSFPQLIFIIGLPAAGKSYFTENDLPKYFPAIKQARTLDNDNQLTAKQREYMIDFARSAYEIETERDYKKFVEAHEKRINSSIGMAGHDEFKISTDWNWISAHKDLAIGEFLSAFAREFFVKDWASNFEPRPMALGDFKNLVNKKFGAAESEDIIQFNNNDIIIPTLGSSIDKIHDFILQCPNTYIPSIVYLDMPTDEAIEKDKGRKNDSGRGVGEELIREKAPLIRQTWKALKSGAYKRYGIYKLMHFVWLPVPGKWGKYELQKQYVNTDMVKKFLSK